MYKATAVISSLFFLLSACGGEEKPTKYSFDLEKTEQSLKGDNIPLEKSLGCTLFSAVLTKEFLNSQRDGKKFDLFKAKATTPTVVNLYEKKIDWLDLGREAPITDGMVDLIKLDEASLKFRVVTEDNSLKLEFKEPEKNTECTYFFKKVE